MESHELDELEAEEYFEAELDEKAIAKAEKIAKERDEVLRNVLTGNITNIKDRVAWILNSSTEARNSDIELAWLYWQTFENDNVIEGAITKLQMFKLTRIPSLTRIRAKIQNEYKLFQADDKIKRHRGKLEEEKRNEALEDKPTGIGLYTVYIDETGKTQEYLSVGSLWVLKHNISAQTKALFELQKWKKEQNIDFEFHFSEVSKNKLPIYKDFFIRFLTVFPEMGFKLIVVNNKGFSDRNRAIEDLTFHLLNKGIEHEHAAGRASLPRNLQVWIDEEEKGSDQLKIENIKERLRSQKVQGLYLKNFEAVSSKGNFEIQMVDLFTGAINRKLHNPNSSQIKDELADFILDILKFDISQINRENIDVDQSAVFNLADYEPTVDDK